MREEEESLFHSTKGGLSPRRRVVQIRETFLFPPTKGKESSAWLVVVKRRGRGSLFISFSRKSSSFRSSMEERNLLSL